MRERDPFPFDGPITRADGVRPFNGYLWPTESWWAYHEFGHNGFSGRFHFGIVALADGRWATAGFVWQIETNSDNPHGTMSRPGRPVVFKTRDHALRIAVARFIRLCRWARRWTGTPDHLTEANCQRTVNWALAIAKRPGAALMPLPLPRARTGLPLFDMEADQR